MGKNTGKNKRDGKNTGKAEVEAKVAEVAEVEVVEVAGPRPSKNLSNCFIYHDVHFVNQSDESKASRTFVTIVVQEDGIGRILTRNGAPFRPASDGNGGGRDASRVLNKTLDGFQNGTYLPSDWKVDFGEQDEVTLPQDCLDWMGLDSAERRSNSGNVTHWRLASEEEQVALRAKATSRNRFAAELAKLRRPDAPLAAPVIVPTVAEPVVDREALKAEILAEIAAEAEAKAKAEAEALALVEAEAAKEREMTELKSTVSDMAAMMAVMMEAMAAAKQ